MSALFGHSQRSIQALYTIYSSRFLCFPRGIVKTIIARVQTDGAQEEKSLCIGCSDNSADSMLTCCHWASCRFPEMHCHFGLSFWREKAICSYSSRTINMYESDESRTLTDVVEAVSAYGQSSLLTSISSCYRYLFFNKGATLGTPLEGALMSKDHKAGLLSSIFISSMESSLPCLDIEQRDGLRMANFCWRCWA